MTRNYVLLLLLALAAGPSAAWIFSARGAEQTAGEPLTPVSYKNVRIDDPFWSPRIERNRDVTIPSQLGRAGGAGGAGGGRGGSAEARVVEAVCYEIGKDPTTPLRARVEGTFDGMITRAKSVMGRWPTAGDGSFYGAGTFIEAAIAYYDATGSRKLLDPAIEIADDLDNQFGPGKRHDISNHEGVEVGLTKLARATGNPKYLKLAEFLIEARGNPEGRTTMYGPYAQDDVPILKAPRTIGHAVRATYLYMPMTDVAMQADSPAYTQAIDRIWQDALGKRTYLTGGIGSYRDQENYGDDYDLPNAAAWNEICAAYGNTLWHQRMALLHADAQYADAMENVLYNGFLVGVSQSGDKFLYQSPLRTFSAFERQPSFGPNCCPPNLVRLMSQLGGLIYAQKEDAAYVNLYIGSTADLTLRGKPTSQTPPPPASEAPLKITQVSHYPWEGNIKLTVTPQNPRRFALHLRIPGWTKDAPLAGGLYEFQPLPKLGPIEMPTIKVNGASAPFDIENGYAKIDRQWKAGDTVELNLPMPVRRVVANPKAIEDAGMVALMRGPIVYCAEKADNPDGVFNLQLTDDKPLDFKYHEDLLGGMGVVTGTASALNRAGATAEVARKDTTFTAIPYFAFGNRAPGEMSVWLARDARKAVIAPAPTIASTSKATSSSGNGTVAENYPGHNPPTTARRMYPSSQDGSGSIAAIYDQLAPVSSEDGSAPFLRLHPQEGDQVWVQYDFAKPQTASSAEIYWKDDKQYCIAPQAWKLEYKEGNTWKPVDAKDAYGVQKDAFNKVAFTPVTTTALRALITCAPKVYKTNTLGPPDANYMRQDTTWYETGIIEWRVN